MRRLMAVPLLILALGLGGCSSDGDSASPSGPSTGKSPSAQPTKDVGDWAAYYDCLGAQGVTLQETDGGEKRVDKGANEPAALAAAEKACASKLPAKGQADAATLAEARKLSECVRSKGVTDYPDPDPKTGEVPLTGGLAEKVKGDPKVIEALRACNPKAGSTSGGTVVGG